MSKIKIVFLISAFVLIFSLPSCSRTKPDILFGFIKLVLYEGESGRPVERFSFFILPEDDDGIENLDEIFLYNDREQLRWRIKNDEWITHTVNDVTWIGTRSIAIQEGMTLPRGVYRAVLVNKGGERGERNFTFDGSTRFSFPELEIIDDMYTIRSDWPVNRLVGYDRQGNFSTIIVPQAFSGSISHLNLPSAVRTIALWAEDEEHFSSAFTNVVPVR
jgi:hypothetical protein